MNTPAESRRLLFDAMREDEEMRAGRDGTLFAKEHREDAEMTRHLADMNSFGIAFFPHPKPKQKELFP